MLKTCYEGKTAYWQAAYLSAKNLWIICTFAVERLCAAVGKLYDFTHTVKNDSSCIVQRMLIYPPFVQSFYSEFYYYFFADSYLLSKTLSTVSTGLINTTTN